MGWRRPTQCQPIVVISRAGQLLHDTMCKVLHIVAVRLLPQEVFAVQLAHEPDVLAHAGRSQSRSTALQVRGSIPLYWSQQQQGSRLSKPDILLQTFDPLYSATRAHFEDMQVCDAFVMHTRVLPRHCRC